MLMMVVMIATEVNSASASGDDGDGCDSGEDSDGREEAGGDDNGGENSHSKLKTIHSHPSRHRNTTDLDGTRLLR